MNSFSIAHRIKGYNQEMSGRISGSSMPIGLQKPSEMDTTLNVESRSPLWPYVENALMGPKILALLNAIQLGALLIAHISIIPAALFALVFVGSSIFGCWQYRRQRRSVKKIFLLFQLNGGSLAFTLGTFMWNGSYLTGTHSLYAEHWVEIAAMFAGMLTILSFYYAKYWPDGKEMYRRLSLFRTSGNISASELYALLTFQGRSTRVLAKLPIIVGISVPLTMLASHVIEHKSYDFFLFVSLTLILCPYLLAGLVARLYLQQRYLGNDDLQVTG
jgi:hypothetical protein